MDIHPSSDATVRIEEGVLESEGEIHGFIEGKPGLTIGGIDVFLINSELSTRTGVRADIIGLAETGHTIIVELKQSQSGRKGSRTALVQALEYAADYRSRSYPDLEEMYKEFRPDDSRSLREAHADYFELSSPRGESIFTKASKPRLILLAENFKASDIDAARYLRDANDVDVTCVEVTAYNIDEDRVFAFETRLESKTSPSTPSWRAYEKSLPWLTDRLAESYYERFGDKFDIESPEAAREREKYSKGNQFVPPPHHPDDLVYTFLFNIFSDPPSVTYGVSPRDNERITGIIDEYRHVIAPEHGYAGTKWRRVRGETRLDDILADYDLETISPDVSETVARILWDDERFKATWETFLQMVEKWHQLIDAKMDSH